MKETLQTHFHCFFNKKFFALFLGALAFTVNIYAQVPTPVLTVNQPSECLGNGSITVNSPVGPQYESTIDFIHFGPDFVNLAPGDYNVTVIDLSTGQRATSSTVTIKPNICTPDITVIDPTECLGNGAIKLNSPVGPQYESTIDFVHFGPDFVNLAPGDYNVTVIDLSTGQRTTSSTVTIKPNICTPDITVIDPTECLGNGSIKLNSPVGINYESTIDFIHFGPDFVNLVPGDYNVTIINISTGHRTKSSTVTIKPNICKPDITVNQPECLGNGSIKVNSPVGIDYESTIDFINFGPDFVNLVPCDYNVTVINISTGQRTKSSTVTIKPNICTPIVQVTPPISCSGNGSISISFPTGTQYEYSFDGGVSFQTGNIKNNLPQGTYKIVVYNTLTGQSTSIMASIATTPPIFDPLPSPKTINCPAVPNFTPATAHDFNNTALSPLFTDKTTAGNSPNDYTITRTWTATDACGTSAAASQIIHVRDMDQPYIYKDGAVLMSSPGTKYQWYSGETPIAGETAQSFYPTTYGDYKVKVTNALGCSRFSDAVHSDVDFANNCPQIHKNFGQACDDDNPNTINDRVRNDCKCRGDYYSSAISVKCPTNITVVSTSKYGTIINWDEYGMFTTNTSLCSVQPNDISVQQTSGYYSGYPFPVNTLVYEEYIATDACGNKSSCSFYVRTSDIINTVSTFSTNRPTDRPINRLTDQSFALYQNVPNPMDYLTRIAFNLPHEAEAKLTIVNMAGQVLYQKTISGQAGYNEISIEKSELITSGVFQYRLDTKNNSATKRMVVIE